MQLTVAIQEFLIAQEADGSSPATLRWYRSLLHKFEVFVGDVELEQVSTARIRDYIIMVRRDYRPDTAHGHVRSQHKFWRWCATEYDLKNPMRNIRYPAQPKQEQPKAAATSDIRRLFDAIDTNSIIGVRDRAILSLLLDTGARVGGISTLTIANLQHRRCVVVEKGANTRAVVFTSFTENWLNEWLAIRAPVEPVFYNLRTLRPLTVSGVQQIFTRLKIKAGIHGRVNPHSFRHAFAREYLLAGGDLSTLSRLMGHRDISTTAAFYAVFTDVELAGQHDQFSQIRHLMEDET